MLKVLNFRIFIMLNVHPCVCFQVYSLQMKLLKATDQACDLLMQLSNADLMSVLKKNYSQLQNLLLLR